MVSNCTPFFHCILVLAIKLFNATIEISYCTINLAYLLYTDQFIKKLIKATHFLA